MRQIFLCLLAGSLLYSCKSDEAKVAGASATEPSFDPTSAKAAIDQGNEKLSKAMSEGDSAAVVACYTSDSKVFPPGMPEGTRESMGGMVKGMKGAGINNVKLTASAVHGSGDLLIEEGKYTIGDSSKVFETGKYMVIWKKEGEQWKLHRDIWNSDTPPALQH